MSMVDISPAERRIADRVDAGVTQTLVVSDTGAGVAFSNVGEMIEFAKMMAVSSAGVRKHLRGNAGACLAILTQALEWGMTPFAVANKSYFVNDQIAFESQLVQAVILKRAPIKGRIKFEYSGEGQSRVCRAWARLRDDDEVVEYTSPALKDIKVKNSPLWGGDPDQQLAYFSGRSLCRRHFPDVLLGIYDADELEREAPTIGPDRAKDVTPRSLGSKLDALAAKPSPPARRPPPPIDHDPDTGEVIAGHAAAEGTPVEPSLDTPTDESEPVTPRDRVLDELRAGIMDGKKLLTLLNALPERDRSLVTDEDRKSLKAVEKSIAQQQGGE